MSGFFRLMVTVVALFLSSGKVSASTTLTILNNQHNLECGMQTVLTCELQSPPVFPMHWLVDGSSVSECDTVSCKRKYGMSANYNTTVTAVGNIFEFYISPVDILDNKTFTCTDGDASNDIRITTEDVKINKSLTTITKTIVGNNVVFDVTTNCVFHPDAVKLSLESKKVNGNGGFTSFQVDSTNTAIVCSNTENGYCGGNKTNKLNLNFAISTENNGGEMHEFKLRIIQTLENGNNYIITFENDEIGQLKLPKTTSVTRDSQVKDLCSEERTVCVISILCVCLTVICAVTVVIKRVYSRCKGHVNGMDHLI